MNIVQDESLDVADESASREVAASFFDSLLPRLPVGVRVDVPGADEPLEVPLADLFRESQETRDGIISAALANLDALCLPDLDRDSWALAFSIAATHVILEIAPGLVSGDAVVPTVAPWDQLQAAISITSSAYLNLDHLVASYQARRRARHVGANSPTR